MVGIHPTVRLRTLEVEIGRPQAKEIAAEVQILPSAVELGMEHRGNRFGRGAMTMIYFDLRGGEARLRSCRHSSNRAAPR